MGAVDDLFPVSETKGTINVLFTATPSKRILARVANAQGDH